MKRWAFLTVFLYAIILILLAGPLMFLCLGRWWGRNGGIWVSEALEIYQAWGFWIWLAVFVLGQTLLLLIPVDLSQRRLIPRRKLLVPILTAAFFLANVVLSAAFAIGCALLGDDALESFDFYAKIGGFGPTAVLLIIIAVLWSFWSFVFYRTTRTSEPADAAARITRWLLHGSILELLVAVPSHIVVRNRDVCCAPAASFWGITTGLSVMLLCYGPGVFFLFADRIARKRPSPQKSDVAVN